MFTNHRRALWCSLALLGSLGFLLVGVGRHPAELAPLTTIPFLGRVDQGVYDTMQDLRAAPLTAVSRFLSFIGGGAVTTPIRMLASLVLAQRRHWRPFVAFVLTWVASEVTMTSFKVFFHRGRPSDPLVATAGFAFPSGHATAGAALAVALVLAFLPAGDRRRRWEWRAAGFAFVMACSRVYLNAHWLSDVVAGTLLGSGIAIGSAALVTEVARIWRSGAATAHRP
jgi:undecaprenyl-diphosphatase